MHNFFEIFKSPSKSAKKVLKSIDFRTFCEDRTIEMFLHIPLRTSFFELGIDISLCVQQESLYHFSFLPAAVIVFTNNFYYVFIRDFRQIP